MPNKIISVHFTLNGVPQGGLTPHIDIYELNPLVPTTNTTVVSAEPLTEIAAGWYRYDFAGYDPHKNYVFTVDGGNVLPAGQRYKTGGNDSYEEEISAQVWNEQLIDHTSSGSAGMALNQIKADVASLAVGDTTLASLLNTLLKYERNRTRIDAAAATLTIYDDDGTTPLTVFDLKDLNGMPSVLEVCERMPQ